MPSKKGTEVRKKVTKKVNAVKARRTNRVTITAAQAKTLQNALAKAGKNYKFLDTKLQNLEA